MRSDGTTRALSTSERIAYGAKRCGSCSMLKGNGDFTLSVGSCDDCTTEKQRARLLRAKAALAEYAERQAAKVIQFPAPVQHPTSEVA